MLSERKRQELKDSISRDGGSELAVELLASDAALAEAVAKLREITDSVPATYDASDPMVQRHARALNEGMAWLAKRGGTK